MDKGLRQQAASGVTPDSLLERVNFFRIDATRRLRADTRAELGQFFTPPSVARLMASMFVARSSHIRLLDAGAGVGSLSAAVVAEMCSRESLPKEITVTACEIDPMLAEYLNDSLELCRAACANVGVAFSSIVLPEDFVAASVAMLRGDMFASPLRTFNAAILNPPYHKILSSSKERRLLREIGVEISNIYAGFLSLAIRLLEPRGELVAITPRSFCNGTYFRTFRKWLLATVNLQRVHVFERRDIAFQEDDVLQENVIFHVRKGGEKFEPVTISSSSGPNDEYVTARKVPYEEVVRPSDPDSFIHLVPDELGRSVSDYMSSLRIPLSELGLSVSTGRVVDFRAIKYICDQPGNDTVPLIYPGHLCRGYVAWPEQRSGKKPNAIIVGPETESLLVPTGVYVLVKRFSAKEERRRVVAAICDPERVRASKLGFENHLNYFHVNGQGLPWPLAKGLAVFLNSTLLDMYFRQFNGHTQVNATDLRNLRYPTREKLDKLGNMIGDAIPDQQELDRMVEQELFSMSDNDPNPSAVKRKIEEAEVILKALGLPRTQQNERSALTLLALLDLKPEMPWTAASNPLCGITPMMEFFSKHYSKTYAPNTRETVRRQTVHQFIQAGLVVINPDNPSRPVNSPKAVYQIERAALALLRSYGTTLWVAKLRDYMTSVDTLARRYARERQMGRIPLQVSEETAIWLTPGGQNVLVEKILTEFCPRFTPGGKLAYVGDAGDKWAYFGEALLASLGVRIEAHGKMPDLVVYYGAENWLVLIEAVTSHGPVNAKRRQELEELFSGSTAALVFVTAFLDRRTMIEYLHDISWETEVWLADTPSHMIHFNGERFLGPY